MSGSFVHKSIIAGCRCFVGSLPSGPHMRDTMADVQNPGSRLPTGMRQRRFILAVLIAGLVVAVGVIALTRGPDPATTGAPSASRSSTATVDVTTTTIGEREKVIARLRAILRVRDRAYRERDVGLLREVYTTDCPCLRGDGRAIQQLIKDDAVWVGASTSVRVQKFERVSDRLWIVVATFIGSPFRIETESGSLIRAVEGQSEPFRFALARTESDELLLGFAGPVDKSD
jgi:hypothetical protein